MQHALRLVLLVPLATVATGLRVGSSEPEPYYWPSARGRANSYGVSGYDGPSNLTASLAWEWHHPDNRYATITLGTVIDDKRNIYLAADDSIRKFNAVGDLLWKWSPAEGVNIPTVPCLYQGALYGTTTDGHVYALSMLTGKELWTTRVALKNGETGSVQAKNDVVLVAADADGPKLANKLVVGLDSTTGQHLWDFMPTAPVWNFLALFVPDNKKPSFVFQDLEGRGYKVEIATGNLLWQNGGYDGTWTDGSVMLANGMVYTVALHGCCCGPCSGGREMHESTMGTITAFRVRDGSLVWKKRVWRPPNIIPAVGRLTSDGPQVVIVPMGQNCGPMVPSDLFVLNANTGETAWHLSMGRNPHIKCAGDLEGLEYRRSHGVRECKAPPFSAPTIDFTGTIYLGNMDGNFYSVKQDKSGTGGYISSKIDAGAAFTSPGSAHAPGMVVVTSCDGLFVFNSHVRKVDFLTMPQPTVLEDAVDANDTSPAALWARKVEEKMGSPQAVAKWKEEMDLTKTESLKMKKEQEKQTGRTELKRMKAKTPNEADFGDDEGLPDFDDDSSSSPAGGRANRKPT